METIHHDQASHRIIAEHGPLRLVVEPEAGWWRETVEGAATPLRPLPEPVPPTEELPRLLRAWLGAILFGAHRRPGLLITGEHAAEWADAIACDFGSLPVALGSRDELLMRCVHEQIPVFDGCRRLRPELAATLEDVLAGNPIRRARYRTGDNGQLVQRPVVLACDDAREPVGMVPELRRWLFRWEPTDAPSHRPGELLGFALDAAASVLAHAPAAAA